MNKLSIKEYIQKGEKHWMQMQNGLQSADIVYSYTDVELASSCSTCV